MIEYDDLKKIAFFKDFTEDELRSLQGICCEESYKKGDFVFVEDSLAEHLYVLKKGMISIDIKVTGGKYISVLTVSHFADSFGWSALVEPFKFTASARCVKDSSVFSIDGKKLMALIEKDYRMGFLIMRRVAKMTSERVLNTRLQLIQCFYG
ncbi:MAG: cyclic nucleotide-binding domain-containing protein [Thermodesulfobacteriota bacterium]